MSSFHPHSFGSLQSLPQHSQRPAGAISLAWLLAKPQVTSVIFGARTVAQLDDNLAAADLVLDAKHVEALDKASAFEVGYPYSCIGMTQSTW